MPKPTIEQLVDAMDDLEAADDRVKRAVRVKMETQKRVADLVGYSGSVHSSERLAMALSRAIADNRRAAAACAPSTDGGAS